MIYAIQAGRDGDIKIGYAFDTYKRMSQLQTANSEPLRILKVISGNKKIEKKIHLDLADFRKAGEWFEAAPEVLKYIANLGDIQYKIKDGKAYLILWRNNEKNPTDSCAFCGVRHSHSIQDGHRSPHCVTKEGSVVASDGTVLYQSRGYYVRTRLVSIDTKLKRVMEHNNSIKLFIDEYCEIDKHSVAKLNNTDLYAVYKQFCVSSKKLALSHRSFTQFLLSLDLRQRRAAKRFWVGIRLRNTNK